MAGNSELIDALHQICKEKGIDEEIIFEAIESSLVSACKKNFGTSQNAKVVVDRETANVEVYSQKIVVEEVADTGAEISYEDAKKINGVYEIGDFVDIQITPRNFGRIAAQTAKQVILQKIREAERDILFNEFLTKEKEIVFGKIQRKDRKNIIIGLGKVEAILPFNEQIPFEEYNSNDRIRVYVLEVKQTTKGPLVNVSRTHPDLVRRLFELEVPEVKDGIVEIKSIAREAGSRTKIAVHSKDPNVDAVGACVGPSGYRVNVVVGELRGEKIDIVNYSDDARKYIKAALSPSKVVSVRLNDDAQSAVIVVPDHQLSLAIGKEGQNARLAAKLTGWKIDIKSESQAGDIIDDTFNFMDEFDKALLNSEDYEPIENEENENGFEDELLEIPELLDDLEIDDLIMGELEFGAEEEPKGKKTEEKLFETEEIYDIENDIENIGIKDIEDDIKNIEIEEVEAPKKKKGKKAKIEDDKTEIEETEEIEEPKKKRGRKAKEKIEPTEIIEIEEEVSEIEEPKKKRGRKAKVQEVEELNEIEISEDDFVDIIDEDIHADINDDDIDIDLDLDSEFDEMEYDFKDDDLYKDDLYKEDDLFKYGEDEYYDDYKDDISRYVDFDDEL